MRILTEQGALRGPFAASRIVIQVGRSEDSMKAQMRDLAVMLVLGLPVAVAVAGIGGYALARRALAPIERMTEHARTITAERLHDRLPVGNPDDEWAGSRRYSTPRFGARAVVRADAPFHRRCIASAADAAHRDSKRWRSRAAHRPSGGIVVPRHHRQHARGNRSLAVLVDRLLTLSRAEMGQGTFARDTVNLTELAEDVVGHLGVLAEEKSLTVDATGAPTAVADRVVLRQALINLVDNAIKFTPAGGAVSIRVSGTDGTATLDVSDTGSGIPDEARDRVFDRFYQGDEDAAAGSGLGLSIAKSAVEANGGELTVARSGPQGTTFRITFPRRSSAERAVTQPTVPRLASRPVSAPRGQRR